MTAPALPNPAQVRRMQAAAARQKAAVAAGGRSYARECHEALEKLSGALRDAQAAGLGVPPVAVLSLAAIGIGTDVLARQEAVELDRIEYPVVPGQPALGYPGTGKL